MHGKTVGGAGITQPLLAFLEPSGPWTTATAGQSMSVHRCGWTAYGRAILVEGTNPTFLHN